MFRPRDMALAPGTWPPAMGACLDPIHHASIGGALSLLLHGLWTGNDIVSKLALGQFSLAAMAWLRWLVAVLILTPFLARRP